jgi:hypothetical protein
LIIVEVGLRVRLSDRGTASIDRLIRCFEQLRYVNVTRSDRVSDGGSACTMA